MTNLPLAQIYIGIGVLIILSVVVFYYLKLLLNSIIQGFIYTFLIAVLLFFLGMWYFLGLDRAFLLIKNVLHL